MTQQGDTDVFPRPEAVSLHIVITHLAVAIKVYLLICTHHTIKSSGDFRIIVIEISSYLLTVRCWGCPLSSFERIRPLYN